MVNIIALIYQKYRLRQASIPSAAISDFHLHSIVIPNLIY